MYILENNAWHYKNRKKWMENSLKCHWTLKNVQTVRAEPFISVKKPNLTQWAFLHWWRALPETFVHFLMFHDPLKSFPFTFSCDVYILLSLETKTSRGNQRIFIKIKWAFSNLLYQSQQCDWHSLTNTKLGSQVSESGLASSVLRRQEWQIIEINNNN